MIKIIAPFNKKKKVFIFKNLFFFIHRIILNKNMTYSLIQFELDCNENK